MTCNWRNISFIRSCTNTTFIKYQLY